MPTRIKAKPSRKRKTTEVEEPQPEAHGSDLADLAQEWLEEIDKVLEGEAEGFVRNFVQKGGE